VEIVEIIDYDINIIISMGKIEIGTIVLVTLLAFSLYHMDAGVDGQSKSLFQTWKSTYGKTYKGVEEETYRFNVWRKNLEYVEEHNQKFMTGQETF